MPIIFDQFTQPQSVGLNGTTQVDSNGSFIAKSRRMIGGVVTQGQIGDSNLSISTFFGISDKLTLIYFPTTGFSLAAGSDFVIRQKQERTFITSIKLSIVSSSGNYEIIESVTIPFILPITTNLQNIFSIQFEFNTAFNFGVNDFFPIILNQPGGSGGIISSTLCGY